MSGVINSEAPRFVVTQNNTDYSSTVTPGSHRSSFLQLSEAVHNNADAVFTQVPHMALNGKAMVQELIHECIPQDLANLSLSGESQDIKSLIGIIYPEVKKSGNEEDFKRLSTICTQLKTTPVKRMDGLVKSLLPLVSKYGPSAITALGNKVINKSQEAWVQHHNSRSVEIDNKQAFNQLLEACKNLLSLTAVVDVKGMKVPELAQMTRHILAGCETIPLTLQRYDAAPVNLADNNPLMRNEPQRVEGAVLPGHVPSFTQTTGAVTVNVVNPGSANTTQNANLADSLNAILHSDLASVDKMELSKLLIATTAGKGTFLNNVESVTMDKPKPRADSQLSTTLVENSGQPESDSSLANAVPATQTEVTKGGSSQQLSQTEPAEQITTLLANDVVDGLNPEKGEQEVETETRAEFISASKQTSIGSLFSSMQKNNPEEKQDEMTTSDVNTETESKKTLSGMREETPKWMPFRAHEGHADTSTRVFTRNRSVGKLDSPFNLSSLVVNQDSDSELNVKLKAQADKIAQAEQEAQAVMLQGGHDEQSIS